MISLYKAYKHLKTVRAHRREVRRNCFRMGLYWQGLTHDLSKYSWPEFRIGATYFMDDQSPHNGERAEFGYSSAWLHHKGRNKHRDIGGRYPPPKPTEKSLYSLHRLFNINIRKVKKISRNLKEIATYFLPIISFLHYSALVSASRALAAFLR